MSYIDAFWSRMVIFVDQESDPIPAVRSYLAWFRNEPLDIHILRCSRGADAHSEEKTRVASIMKLIIPHLPRWNRLHTDVV